MNPKPERHNGLTICLAAIGVLLFVSASGLLVLSKAPETAGVPLVAALGFLAVAACCGAKQA